MGLGDFETKKAFTHNFNSMGEIVEYLIIGQLNLLQMKQPYILSVNDKYIGKIKDEYAKGAYCRNGYDLFNFGGVYDERKKRYLRQ